MNTRNIVQIFLLFTVLVFLLASVRAENVYTILPSDTSQSSSYTPANAVVVVSPPESGGIITVQGNSPLTVAAGNIQATYTTASIGSLQEATAEEQPQATANAGPGTPTLPSPSVETTAAPETLYVSTLPRSMNGSTEIPIPATTSTPQIPSVAVNFSYVPSPVHTISIINGNRSIPGLKLIGTVNITNAAKPGQQNAPPVFKKTPTSQSKLLSVLRRLFGR
ncbi:hypothetical protein HZB01_05440 [Candidatus Woesearchaeota archaeon]|nr:hypothetical protein [Candidatus Woesearchaeota archaeon]